MSDELRGRLMARIKETRPDACVASSLEGWSHDAFDRYIADAAIALIWNEAMEEAAEICEAKGEEWRADGNISAGVGCNTCTDAIRARKKP